MVHIVRKGYELIIVHGNGPQVGNLLIQMEEAADKIPPYTLDVCDAMTEGSMGFMLERAIINELRRRSIDKEVATLVTQVVVDRDDPAFAKPTKPVGPFYSKFRAEQLAREKNWTMVEDAGRGYRKVVPSPGRSTSSPRASSASSSRPAASSSPPAAAASRSSSTATASSRASRPSSTRTTPRACIAREVKVDLFIILTAIERVFINFGKPDQTEVPVLTVDEARRHLADGQFPPGSMGPKIRAAIDYIEAGGREVLITKDSHLKAALLNRSGTRIVASA